MKLSIDTKEDSHEDIRKVIKMLQHIVGDTQEVFTNQPQTAEMAASPFDNIFGESSQETTSEITQSSQEAQSQPETEQAQEETSESTEDLFAELFSEEEIKKMDESKSKEEEEDEEEETPQAKAKKKYDIEFY